MQKSCIPVLDVKKSWWKGPRRVKQSVFSINRVYQRYTVLWGQINLIYSAITSGIWLFIKGSV